VVKSLEWMPYTTEVRKESVQKGVVMYPYGKNKYGGYRGEGEWDASGKNPHTTVWMGMLMRTCSDEFKQKHKSYTEARVCEEFMNLQVFCNWSDSAKPKDTSITWELDKDLLGDGKLYSPSTCCYLPKELNLFLSKLDRQYIPRTAGGKYSVWCSDGVNKDNRYVGTFDTKEEAVGAWKKTKNARLHSLIEKYKQLLPANVLEALYKLEK
jgi:hypothetical protein